MKINIIIHSYKSYRKGKYFITFGFITFIRQDVLEMLDRAAEKYEKLLGYKAHKTHVKI